MPIYPLIGGVLRCDASLTFQKLWVFGGSVCNYSLTFQVLTAVPKGKFQSVALMLKAIHAQVDREAARQKAKEVVVKLGTLKLEKAARIVEGGYEETLSYYAFPPHHWRSIAE